MKFNTNLISGLKSLKNKYNSENKKASKHRPSNNSNIIFNNKVDDNKTSKQETVAILEMEEFVIKNSDGNFWKSRMNAKQEEANVSSKRTNQAERTSGWKDGGMSEKKEEEEEKRKVTWFKAVANGDRDVIGGMLERDVSIVMLKNEKGYTALHQAIEQGSDAILNLLVTAIKLSNNKRNNDVNTKLQRQASNEASCRVCSLQGEGVVPSSPVESRGCFMHPNGPPRSRDRDAKAKCNQPQQQQIQMIRQQQQMQRKLCRQGSLFKRDESALPQQQQQLQHLDLDVQQKYSRHSQYLALQQHVTCGLMQQYQHKKNCPLSNPCIESIGEIKQQKLCRQQNSHLTPFLKEHKQQELTDFHQIPQRQNHMQEQHLQLCQRYYRQHQLREQNLHQRDLQPQHEQPQQYHHHHDRQQQHRQERSRQSVVIVDG